MFQKLEVPALGLGWRSCLKAGDLASLVSIHVFNVLKFHLKLFQNIDAEKCFKLCSTNL